MLVHVNDPFSGVAIGEETAWGVIAPGTFYSLPLVEPGESMQKESGVINEPTVFTSTGARETAEYGRSTGKGSITVEARYDSVAFNLLLAYAMGDEQVIANKWVDGTTLTGSGYAHVYSPAALGAVGLSIKIWKSGLTNAGTLETYLGCVITSFKVQQDSDKRQLWTFNFICKPPTFATGSLAAIPAISGSQIAKFRHLSNAGGYFKTGATLTALGIDSFSINFDKKVVPDNPFATAPDTFDQPAPNDLRETVLDIQSRLEQDYYATNRPYKEGDAKTASKADAVFASDVALGDKVYAMRIEMPTVYWSKVDATLKSTGSPPTNFVATAISGTFANGPTTVITAGDMRIIVCNATSTSHSLL
jgi:hypothetical protein